MCWWFENNHTSWGNELLKIVHADVRGEINTSTEFLILEDDPSIIKFIHTWLKTVMKYLPNLLILKSW